MKFIILICFFFLIFNCILCFLFDLNQLTWVEERRKTFCMALCSAANSKLDTISSTHVRVCMIRHLSKKLVSAWCGIYDLECRYLFTSLQSFIFFCVLSLSIAFPKKLRKIELRIYTFKIEVWVLSRFSVNWLIIVREAVLCFKKVVKIILYPFFKALKLFHITWLYQN